MKRKFEDSFEESDGESWHRGPLLGKGGFGSVYLAELKNPNSRNGYFPELMAIKSAKVTDAASLEKEIQVFHDLGTCPFIINCYGDEITMTKSGEKIYNILLEYASEGALFDVIKDYGGCAMPEADVKSVARCLLEGIEFIHSRGYVHCDLKPDNVLLAFHENSECVVSKIGDFGLAKGYTRSTRMKVDSNGIGGTPLYMAPETVIDGIQGPPCDIWALGCIVYEMLTGKQVCDPTPGMTKDEIFRKISDRCELPQIPANISEEGKNFLKSCLVRNPMFRFTARMLLNHAFVSGTSGDKIGESLEEERVELQGDEKRIDDGKNRWSYSSSSFSEDENFPSPTPKEEKRIEFNKNMLDFLPARIVV
ncbi:mitogen-activated protein kinase kinase kinase 20 [Euphorbia peplus]|nr:mitogen-activated protein kinase kinase kinase 20 [Euphorbia peplus]